MRNEILVYLFLGLSIFLVLTIPGFIYDSPNLSEPDQVVQTTGSTTSRTSRSQTSEPPIDPPSTGFNAVPNIFQALILIVAIIAIIILLSQFRDFKENRIKRGSSEKKEKEKVGKLSRARDTALIILQNSLIEGNYTDAFIEAYQELDINLEYFRDVSRPKHFTPREYSFTVREPIFKPNVYRFVKIFYRLRYGNGTANIEDIQEFIDALTHLFVDELSKEIQDELLTGFNREYNSYSKFYIPTQFDPTKPKGGKI